MTDEKKTRINIWIIILGVGIFAAILGVDAWLYSSYENSFSIQIIELSKLTPFVPALMGLVVGFLLGHWFG